MRFASIGSGSRGNGTLICNGQHGMVMLDCGFSARDAQHRMALKGVEAAHLSAILVTHEHTDHVKGVARLANLFRIPVYATWGTFAGGLNGTLDEALFCRIEPGEPISIAGMSIAPVAVPHDAREPCQFVFGCSGARLGVLTDTGSFTAQMVEQYRGCDALMLECNHDLHMLSEGPYPAQLKRRVAGAKGHLNNQQATEFLDQVGHSGLRHVVVTHISQKNNSTDLAMNALQGSLYGSSVSLKIAQQDSGLDWVEVSAPVMAQKAGSVGQQFSLNLDF